mmetsp:Transcript_21987/g.62427  ORF Transcript_21987/g.62427 Transcript_21987/m.62427 type:complete len:272 (-) Transcript_21987:85-900(-)
MEKDSRSRESQCSCCYCILDDLSHHLNFLRLNRTIFRPTWPIRQVCAMSHNPSAQRRMANQHSNVAHQLAAFKKIHILFKRLPLPGDPLVQGCSWNVFDSFHQPYEELAMPLSARGESNATAPHHARSDAAQAARSKVGIPGHLPIEVSVHVHPARRDQESTSIHLEASPDCQGGTNCDDRCTIDRDVALEGQGSCAINDSATANDNVCLWKHFRRPRKQLSKQSGRQAHIRIQQVHSRSRLQPKIRQLGISGSLQCLELLVVARDGQLLC